MVSIPDPNGSNETVALHKHPRSCLVANNPPERVEALRARLDSHFRNQLTLERQYQRLELSSLSFFSRLARAV